MFSWSQAATNRASNSSNQYPGRRTTTPSTQNGVTATVVEGSIRPPYTLTRAQHLESYLDDPSLSRSTRRVSASDDTTYDTVFQTTKGDTLIIRVHVPLASSFASFCPAMTLAGVRVRHKWVEERTMRIIGYEPIENEAKWKSSGLSLGQVVHAVVKHLQVKPPEILEITDPGLQAIQPANSPFRTGGSGSTTTAPPSRTVAKNGQSGAAPPSYSAHQYFQTTPKEPQLPPAPDVPLPPIPRDVLAMLDTKSTEELENILQNDLEFFMFVNNLPIAREIHRIAISNAEETKQLAKENLEGEHALKSTHAEVEQLRDILREKVKTFQKLEAEQNAQCAPPNVRETMGKLKEAKKQAFDESEAFAESWVDDGAANVDKFMEEFITQRKIHHQRAAKMEVLERQEQRRGRR